MKVKKLKPNNFIRDIKLSTVFALSALFFAFSNFFGVYTRTIYHRGYFVLYFVMEVLFFLGLKSGCLVLSGHGTKKRTKEFSITKIGSYIILIVNVLSILSFVYFLYLFGRSIGFSSFGTYSAFAFEDDGRTSLEKFTILLMQLGGEAAFLVTSCDKSDRYKKIKTLSSVCMFLPGLRYLLMGARYTIAVEALLFVIVKGKYVKNTIKNALSDKTKKMIMTLLLVALFVVFMYLFASRSIYYTAVEKFEFERGDIQMRPFWEKMYYATDGKIDFICSFSDYMGEAPYIFTYYCKYGMPEKPVGGVLFLRPIIKIVGNLTGQDYYGDITEEMMSGKYSGCFYSIVYEYGVLGAIVMIYLIGVLFAKIERSSAWNIVSATLYPTLVVMCFFAPVYYFNVGRLDFTVVFSSVLSLVCLKKR